MWALRLSDLRHRWPQQSLGLHVAQVQLAQARHLFIHGPSGCGKTTLLSLLAGVVPVQAGQCEVLGQDLAKMSPRQRDHWRGEHLGVIFQQFNLITYLDVWANVMLPTRLFASRAQAAQRHWGSPAAQAQHVLSGGARPHGAPAAEHCRRAHICLGRGPQRRLHSLADWPGPGARCQCGHGQP